MAHCSRNQTPVSAHPTRSAKEYEVKAEAQSRWVQRSLREDRKAPQASGMQSQEDPIQPHCRASSREGRTQAMSSGQPSWDWRGTASRGDITGRWGFSVGVRSWVPTGQHRGQLQPPEQSRNGLLGGAAATQAHLRGHPGLAGRRYPGRRPRGRRRQGHQRWFPSSQTRNWSAPASWPPPLVPPDLA